MRDHTTPQAPPGHGHRTVLAFTMLAGGTFLLANAWLVASELLTY